MIRNTFLHFAGLHGHAPGVDADEQPRLRKVVTAPLPGVARDFPSGEDSQAMLSAIAEEVDGDSSEVARAQESFGLIVEAGDSLRSAALPIRRRSFYIVDETECAREDGELKMRTVDATPSPSGWQEACFFPELACHRTDGDVSARFSKEPDMAVMTIRNTFLHFNCLHDHAPGCDTDEQPPLRRVVTAPLPGVASDRPPAEESLPILSAIAEEVEGDSAEVSSAPQRLELIEEADDSLRSAALPIRRRSFCSVEETECAREEGELKVRGVDATPSPGSWQEACFFPELPCHFRTDHEVSAWFSKEPQRPSEVVEQSCREEKISASPISSEHSHPTSFMLRNLPVACTREYMLALLSTLGFGGKFDFLYVPVDFNRHGSLGYAFINLVSSSDAETLVRKLDGFSSWPIPCSKVCKVTRSDMQGLEAHIARYRNSPLMHEDVPETYRPILLAHGQQIPFPAPTKKIKPPRQGSTRMFAS